MTGREQIPDKNDKKTEMADARVFVGALKNLDSLLSSALRGGTAYIARFSGGFENNIDPVLQRILSASPPENVAAELRSVRDVFRGFDGFSDSEKMEILRISANTVSAVVSRFQNVSLAKPGSKPRPSGLRSPVDSVRGVGSSVSSFLAKKDVRTVRDALFYFPLRYEDRRNIKWISSAEPNSWQTVAGRVESAGRTRPGPGARFRVVLEHGGTRLDLVWFNFDERYLRNRYKKGKLVLVSGDICVDTRRGSLQILHPGADRIEVLDKQDEARDSIHINRIVPVYPLTEGLGQRRLRGVMKNVAGHSALLDGIVPTDCARGLVPLGEAVKEMHFPEKSDGCPDFSRSAWETGGRDRRLPAPRTVAFFEFFLFQLAVGIRKKRRDGSGGVAFGPEGEMSRRFLDGLPFKLTDAQQRAFSRIRRSMESSCPMNMLLQGDVGSGKTVIALLAMIKAVDSGYQAALMAPTQILAEQHASFVSRHTGGLGLETVLLKGGDSGSRLESVENGDVRLVIGTHALIQDRVKFARLGLAVVDEQHKFGVVQREKLGGKGASPDILVMTATPIPRSLAMTVYGDLDVATVDRLPAGRKPVETVVLGNSPRDRKTMIEAMRQEVEAGRQCYVVCPFIGCSEDCEGEAGDVARVSATASNLRKELPGVRISVLHGRMPSDEKESVMNGFSGGEISVLVSTTVIEVGIDVPNATLIVIENADRFGISQLHQLRGRVGRGAGGSICILLKSAEISEEGAQRLEAIRKTSDGFSIAEADLAIRGPGQFLGTKQSGMPDFRFADLIMDTEVLTEARGTAAEILEKDPELRNHPKLRETLGFLK